ncbi:unnamed protein product [Mytilus coruscus]|uniref:C-type lectin domain-containing protein n=1 Tax=Mytilus coruscus TaxID=42192 RepID=A0A6J8CYM3_MYTCO|nr:unnamed protein product [Mytilus coruscus]
MAFCSDYWLGGNDEVNEGSWTWKGTDAPVDYDGWHSGEPQGVSAENCMAIYTVVNYRWVDAHCTNSIRYIYEKPESVAPSIEPVTAKNQCTKHKKPCGSIVADCSNGNLTQVPKNLSDNINVLILDHNEIVVIENDTFSNLKVLIELTINNNKLESLQSKAFIGLRSLKTLKMSGNNLDFPAYTPTLFSFIANISLLDISRNLNFSNNAKLSTNYPDKALGVLVNLEILAIDLRPMPVFGEGFKKMGKLKVLEFNNCKVEVLKYSTFINFNRRIEYLHMNKCQQFVKVEEDTLKPFPNLKVLDLSDTYVHPIQAFQLLKSLANSSMEMINFHHVNDESITNNSTYSFEVNITKEMVKYIQTICVEVLDISKNNIVDFEDGSVLTFNRPECLLNISLSENRFSLFHAHRLKISNSFSIELKTLRNSSTHIYL